MSNDTIITSSLNKSNTLQINELKKHEKRKIIESFLDKDEVFM
jgi:hypothetical protein